MNLLRERIIKFLKQRKEEKITITNLKQQFRNVPYDKLILEMQTLEHYNYIKKCDYKVALNSKNVLYEIHPDIDNA